MFFYGTPETPAARNSAPSNQNKIWTARRRRQGLYESVRPSWVAVEGGAEEGRLVQDQGDITEGIWLDNK